MTAMVGTSKDGHQPKPKRRKMTTQIIIKFNVGQTYSARSICDHDCIFSFTILARTAKQVTVKVNGNIVKRGIKIWDNVEEFSPFGNYSMLVSVLASAKNLSPVA